MNCDKTLIVLRYYVFATGTMYVHMQFMHDIVYNYS